MGRRPAGATRRTRSRTATRARRAPATTPGISPLARLLRARRRRRYRAGPMNDPRLNQTPNTVAQTGEFARCTNGFGVFDMVGNLHEWVMSSGRPDLPRRLLPGHAHQRRRLRVPHDGARRGVPRLLDGLSLLRQSGAVKVYARRPTSNRELIGARPGGGTDLVRPVRRDGGEHGADQVSSPVQAGESQIGPLVSTWDQRGATGGRHA